MCHTQELYLSGNQIGDAGVTALANACAGGAMANLTALHLHGNKITDDGFATLFSLLKKDGKLSGLTEFSIGSGVTDKGMKEFSELLAMGAMAQLQVTWRLTVLIPCLETWRTRSPCLTVSFDVSYVPLQTIVLGGNKIGDAGVTALANACAGGAMASLQTLVMDDGPLGVDHPKLKAACQERGITLC